MLRLTSFLSVLYDIEYNSDYYIHDSDYIPPDSNNVDFLMDPNMNVKITSFFESFTRFKTSSFLEGVNSYEFKTSVAFDSPDFTKKVTNRLYCLDECYHPTSFLECFNTFMVSAPFIFLDEQAILVRNAFDSGASIQVKHIFTAEDSFSNVTKNQIYFRNECSFDVKSYLNIPLESTKSIKNKHEFKNDCKNIVTSELENFTDFVDRVKITSPFESLCDSENEQQFNISMTVKV